MWHAVYRKKMNIFGDDRQLVLVTVKFRNEEGLLDGADVLGAGAHHTFERLGGSRGQRRNHSNGPVG